MKYILFCVLACMTAFFAVSCDSGKKKAAPKNGTLEVISSVDTAEIFILGESRGLGSRKFELKEGVYLVKASADGYRTERKLATVKSGRKTVLEMKLRESTGVVLFTSEPSGATVMLDDVELGVTPCISSDVRNGKHTAVFRLPRHATDMKTWTTANSACEIIEGRLSSNTGNLVVTSDPVGARLSIDGKSYGTTPFNEPFDAGEYTVRLESDNNEPYEKKITILRNEDTRVEVKLALLPGGVDISSEPSGARIVLYDASGAAVRGSASPLKVVKLTPGDYRAEASLEGYDTESIPLKVTPGATASETIRLSSNMGGLDIVTHPAGVSVYVNGRFRGATEPESADSETSKTFTLRNLAAGKYRVDYVHKRALPSKRVSMNYVVRKGETLRVPPVSMWVSNAKIVLKNGRQYEGRIVDTAENAETINFQPEPGVGTSYKRSEIESIVRLSTADTESVKARGTLELTVNQPGVQISVNGKRHGVVKAKEKSPFESEKYIIGELEPGVYTVEFSHRHAKPETRVTREYTVQNDVVLRPEAVFLWVPNISVELKNGRKYEARLVEKTENTLVFEPEPGLKLTHKMPDIEKFEPLVK